MIITCPCEKKQFKIDSTLIPLEGRELQCGSCERVWFYKPKIDSETPLTLNENIVFFGLTEFSNSLNKN